MQCSSSRTQHAFCLCAFSLRMCFILSFHHVRSHTSWLILYWDGFNNYVTSSFTLSNLIRSWHTGDQYSLVTTSGLWFFWPPDQIYSSQYSTSFTVFIIVLHFSSLESGRSNQTQSGKVTWSVQQWFGWHLTFTSIPTTSTVLLIQVEARRNSFDSYKLGLFVLKGFIDALPTCKHSSSAKEQLHLLDGLYLEQWSPSTFSTLLSNSTQS